MRSHSIPILAALLCYTPLLWGQEIAPEPMVWTDDTGSKSADSFYSRYAPAETVRLGAELPRHDQSSTAKSESARTIAFQEEIVTPAAIKRPAATCNTCSRSQCSCKKPGFWSWFHRQTRAQPCYAPQPFGYCVNAKLSTQIMKGHVEQQVLYHFDFGREEFQQSGQLSDRGRRQLKRLANKMGLTGHPLKVQGTGNPMVDAQRREAVLEHLAELGMPTSADSVIVEPIRVAGLGGRGERAFPRTPSWSSPYENRMQQTLDRGSRRLLETLGR